MTVNGYIEKKIMREHNFIGYTIKLSTPVKRGCRSVSNLSIEGKFPDCLPNGLAITCEVEPLSVIKNSTNLKDTEYEISFEGRNKVVFENKHTDIHTLKTRIINQKKLNCTWSELIIRENPYINDEIRNKLNIASDKPDSHKDRLYIFKEADKMAYDYGYKANDKRRLAYIIKSVIKDFRGERKCTYSVAEFVKIMMEYENYGAFKSIGISALVNAIKNDDRLIYTEMLLDRELYEARKFIAKNIKERQFHYHHLFTPSQYKELCEKLDKDTHLANAQKEAVKELENTRPTIITGKAGTGKTSTFNAIIKAFCENYGVGRICLLAPTGKASRRMSESTGLDASTIHSKLRLTPDSEFICYTESNPLDYSLFIVDESSMIDDLLMAQLLRAIPNDAKLYLVGDCNQLYPVSTGSPFHDLIENKGCDIVTLTQNFRQSGNGGNAILTNAENILIGGKITPAPSFTIRHIKKSNIKYYVDENIQSISPYNELNTIINNIVLDKHNKVLHHGKFFVGEKIIGLQNTDDFSNGDIGKITEIGINNLRCNFNEKSITISRNDWYLIAPAYSLTVHKTQGSEYDTIRIFLPKKVTSFLSRRLIYTAVTRAKQNVEIFIYSD